PWESVSPDQKRPGLLIKVNRASARRRVLRAEHRRSSHLSHSLDLITQIAVSVTSSLDLKTLLRTTADHAKQLIRAEGAAVLQVDAEKDELWFDATSGGSEAVSSFRIPMDQGVCGWVATHQEPALCDDPDHDPRF